MGWEADLDKYLQSSDVQKQMKTYVARSGGAGGIASGTADVMKYAEMARDAIVASLPEQLRSGSAHPIAPSDLIIGAIKTTTLGDFEVSLSWNPDAVHRDSLWHSGYPNGIKDIVALFNNGYFARKNVYGPWDGASYYKTSQYGHGDNYTNIRSKISREAGLFLQQAVAAFNAAHAADKVKITIDPEYLTK